MDKIMDVMGEIRIWPSTMSKIMAELILKNHIPMKELNIVAVITRKTLVLLMLDSLIFDLLKY